MTVHGDDSTITGPKEDLWRLEEQLKKKYDIKTNYLAQLKSVQQNPSGDRRLHRV